MHAMPFPMPLDALYITLASLSYPVKTPLKFETLIFSPLPMSCTLYLQKVIAHPPNACYSNTTVHKHSDKACFWWDETGIL